MWCRVVGGGLRARGAGVGERVLRVRLRGAARAGAGAAPGRARAPRWRRAPRRAASQDTQQRCEWPEALYNMFKLAVDKYSNRSLETNISACA